MDNRSRRFSEAKLHLQPRVKAAEPGKVDLWHVELERVPLELRQHLSTSDWHEAKRIGAASEREAFLKIRSATRMILSSYLDCPPDSLEFDHDAEGLRLTAPHSLLRFHLSHSENLLLVAVTFARQIGVDVEYMRANLPFEALAEHYFDPRDAQRLHQLAHSDRMRHFYQEWTSSEATRRVVDHTKRCCVLSFTPAKGFSAALAVEGEAFRLDWHRWL